MDSEFKLRGGGWEQSQEGQTQLSMLSAFTHIVSVVIIFGFFDLAIYVAGKINANTMCFLFLQHFLMANKSRNSLKAQQWKEGFDQFENINRVEY